MTEQPQEYIITMARIIKARNMLMADGYRNADVLDRMVNLLRSRLAPPADAPVAHYNGVCTFQDKCNDYSDFIESIEDELNPDDEDPVCPIKCDLRASPLAEHDTSIRKDERERVLEQFAIRVRREFAQDDDEEWYLSSYGFEDCLEELKNDE